MKYALLITTALMITSPAFATEDSFGNRFGQAAPSALGDGMGDAMADTGGFGLDDMDDAAALNAIDPAAGEEDASEDEHLAGDAVISTETEESGDLETDAADGIDADAGAEDAVEAQEDIEADSEAAVHSETDAPAGAVDAIVEEADPVETPSE